MMKFITITILFLGLTVGFSKTGLKVKESKTLEIYNSKQYYVKPTDARKLAKNKANYRHKLRQERED